jgi:signal transduction histidine kinase
VTDASEQGRTGLALRAVIPTLALVVGIAESTTSHGATRDLAVGVVLAVAGAAAIAVNRSSWVGDVLGLAAITWFIGDFASSSSPAVAEAALWLYLVHRAAVAHAVLTFPVGRTRRPMLAVIAALYGLALIPSWLGTPSGSMIWASCVAGAALLGVKFSPPASRTDANWRLVLGFGFAGGLLVTALGLNGPAASVEQSVANATLIYQVTIVATAIAVVVGLAAIAQRRHALSDTIVAVAHGPERAVRIGLARALGDPGLDVLFRDAQGGWVDELGRPSPPPQPESSGQVTLIDLDERQAVAIVRTTTSADDPALAAAIAGAARLAATNVQLRSALRAESAAVADSRRRILVATDMVQAELAEALDAGPGRRIDNATNVLAAAAGASTVDTERVKEMVDRLRRARADIGASVGGLGPLLHADGCLVPALQALADSGPAKVELDLTTNVTGHAATTLWFVAAEGVSNVQKHSGARRVLVRLARVDGDILLEVIDDGHGAATRAIRPSEGTGLRGLRDRVEALGGVLRFETTALGSCLTARLPEGDAQ